MKVVNWILKRKVLVLGLMAVAMLTANAQNLSYIHKHKKIAEDLSNQYGIPSSVILAVAMVESSGGQGKNVKKLNNHFGIVGKNNLAKTTGYKTRYKQYTDANESFADFCKLISRKEFYSKLKDNHDTKEWVKALSRAGYSEQPKVWEKRILNTIHSNQL